MLNFRKGCKVPFPEKLSEGYEYKESCFTANVNADKMEMLLAHFIAIHNEPIFFILELPSNQKDETEIRPGVVNTLHKDVYYIDGCTQEEALAILNRTANLMINDGLCSFGFGCHQSKDEIMVGKYMWFLFIQKTKILLMAFLRNTKLHSLSIWSLLGIHLREICLVRLLELIQTTKVFTIFLIF